jgi:amino acid permease
VDDIPIIHYASTLLIVVLCYVAAVLAPGVAIVWSLCGSSMAFMIAYILPAACYLKLQSSPSWRTGLSWFLIIFSVVGGIACTSQTIIMMHWKEIML